MFSQKRVFFLNGLTILFVLLPAFLAASMPQNRDGAPFISRIIINNDSILFHAGESHETLAGYPQKIDLDKRNSNIAFEISGKDSVEYQFFLEGFDKGRIPGRMRVYKEYTNLPSGHYVFHVYYKGNDNVEYHMSPVPFIIRPAWYLSACAVISYILLFTVITWFFYEQMTYRFARRQYTLEQIINKRTEDLIIEKEKTETLLANVLPKTMADEIIAKGKAAKIKYNLVTVLFSDIQGFTKIAEEMNPEVLIDELDKFFFHFDSVVEKYGIEKIKTIGDAYMCAGGIPEKNRTNPVEVILAALEMQQYMNGLKQSAKIAGLKYWDIRIGIHTGTVVAGVIGHKKLSYDIWGDTVNIASRMESAGEAGKINISGATYEFVKDFFDCAHRGRMPVKYKGELDMYFVQGIVPHLSDQNGKPTRDFFIKLQTMKLLDIEEKVMNVFDNEAPSDLYFHNFSLVKDICNQAELLATAEGLSEEEYISLRLASLFLFTGYITDYEKPLEASIRFAEEILPKYGFDLVCLNETLRLIRASFLNVIEKPADRILHDARYAFLGRDDYKKLSDNLFRELKEHGKIPDTGKWYEVQRKFLLDHEFQTNTARMLRNVPAGEQINNLDVI